jgi:hypothetical protein
LCQGGQEAKSAKKEMFRLGALGFLATLAQINDRMNDALVLKRK